MVGLFIDDCGRVVDTPADQRRMAISARDLFRTPEVVAVAGSQPKAPAIRAVAASRLITMLITDDATAQELLDQPAIDRDDRRDGRPR